MLDGSSAAHIKVYEGGFLSFLKVCLLVCVVLHNLDIHHFLKIK